VSVRNLRVQGRRGQDFSNSCWCRASCIVWVSGRSGQKINPHSTLIAMQAFLKIRHNFTCTLYPSINLAKFWTQQSMETFYLRKWRMQCKVRFHIIFSNHVSYVESQWAILIINFFFLFILQNLVSIINFFKFLMSFWSWVFVWMIF